MRLVCITTDQSNKLWYRGEVLDNGTLKGEYALYRELLFRRLILQVVSSDG